jgi:hypothetical protein
MATLGSPAGRPLRKGAALAAERLSMRKIREILCQKWALGRTHREVAQSLSIGLGTVSGVERRARAADLGWADVEGLADEALETRLFPPGPTGKGPRPWPDPTSTPSDASPASRLSCSTSSTSSSIPTGTATPSSVRSIGAGSNGDACPTKDQPLLVLKPTGTERSIRTGSPGS